MANSPSNDTLAPSFEHAAKLLYEDLRTLAMKAGATCFPSIDKLAAERLIAQRLRHAAEFESVAAEGIATVRGDQLHKQGREPEADVCYGIAAKIRIRRDAWRDSTEPF